MSKLLKKNGKLVKKNGKLVRTNTPANCECCGLEPGVVWTCLDSGGCVTCYNDEAPGVPPNTTGKPNCSSLPPHSGAYGTKPECDANCNQDVVCWVCVSGGICLPQAFNTPGGVCPENTFPDKDTCDSACGGGNPLP